MKLVKAKIHFAKVGVVACRKKDLKYGRWVTSTIDYFDSLKGVCCKRCLKSDAVARARSGERKVFKFREGAVS